MSAAAGVRLPLGLLLLALSAVVPGAESAGAQDRLVAWWSFDADPEGGFARDQAGGVTDPIEGRFTRVPGAVGRAIRLDGFTSLVRRSSGAAPSLSGAFTAEGWVALATYPWNWAPILDHERNGNEGFYFGIGPEGQVGLELSLDGRWQTCRSDRVLELRRFTHVAAVFDPQAGVSLYVDGTLARQCDARGQFETASGFDLLIGMNHEKRVPSHPVRPQATLPAWYTLDGILDEVKLYAAALPAEALRSAFAAAHPPAQPEIPPRVMPSGPAGPGRFGAFYTSLSYYPEWDALWRTSEHADVVVQFDGSPLRVVFWRGTRYSPAWVMEDGTWMADQSAEHFTNHEGCFEHMLDPQNRYSHVRIIENSEARVVVHWRYAPVSVRQEFSQPDERTGWSDWVDEYFTFFPDGIAVRKVVMWTSGRPLGPSEFIVLAHPGSRPEDIIHLDALTLVNLEGESHVYSWAAETPDFTKQERPKAPVIQVVNLKSQHKPFEIFEPGAQMRVFRIEQRREVSHFPWWNHWPEAQIPSDGRYAVAPDRPSHFSLSWGGPPIHKRGDGAYFATWLYGATTKPVAAALARLARSWAQAPALQSSSAGFDGGEFDRTQRAYRLRRTGSQQGLAFRIGASEATPLENASMVIEAWGTEEPTVELDGRILRRQDGLGVGHVRRLDRTDLVLWLPVRAIRPVSARVSVRSPTPGVTR